MAFKDYLLFNFICLILLLQFSHYFSLLADLILDLFSRPVTTIRHITSVRQGCQITKIEWRPNISQVAAKLDETIFEGFLAKFGQ